MGKITKNYIYNIIYQLFVMFVPLVTAPYLARVLGAEGTGIYSYVYSMTAMICTVVLLGIYNYGNRQIAYVRDNKELLSKVFWQIMSARIVIAIVGTVVYFAVVFFLGRYLWLFTLFYTYLLAYFVDCTWLYVGMEDMKWAVIKNTITKVIAVVGIFSLVRSEDDVAVYVLLQGGSILIANLLAYTQLRRYVSKPKLDFTNLKSDIWGAAMLFLPSVAATIYTQCDKVMIELLTNATNEVAFYDYSEKIVMIPLTFITVLSTVMMPRIANEFQKGHKDKISDIMNRSARFSFFLAFPVMFGLISIADKLVPWYLGDEFTPTIYAIMVIAPIVVTNTMLGISGSQYFVATNQIRVLVISQFSAAIANLIINALLIPRFGFYGAAISTLITSFACALIQYNFLLRQIKLHGLLKHSIKYLVLSILMFTAIRLITGTLEASPLTNVFQVFIGIASYTIMCLLIHDDQMKILLSKAKEILFVKK